MDLAVSAKGLAYNSGPKRFFMCENSDRERDLRPGVSLFRPFIPAEEVPRAEECFNGLPAVILYRHPRVKHPCQSRLEGVVAQTSSVEWQRLRLRCLFAYLAYLIAVTLIFSLGLKSCE